jgi:putative transposase
VWAVDCPHHVTQRGNNKQLVFFQDRDRRFYLSALREYCTEWALEVLAYCLMPNHVHVLAKPHLEVSLARAIGLTSQV